MTPSGVVERLLAHRIGLDPSTVGEGLIARGVHARMTALGARDRAEYERILLGTGTDRELQALVEEVVVPESWFFRDDRPFEVFREHARAVWLAGSNRTPLSALSLPCAGGEEPYSLAMTLLDLGLPPTGFRVDGADVSERSLTRAIAGVYGPNSFRGGGLGARARYFREHNGAFTVEPVVRSTVHFRLGNLLDGGLFADRPPFDVVFCRNLMIYLNAPARAMAFETLARLLVDGGLLFLGHADRPDDPAASAFEPVVEKGSFAYRKGRAARATGKTAPKKRSPASYPAKVRDEAIPNRTESATVGPKLVGPANVLPDPSPRRDLGEARKPEGDRSPATALERASALADLGRYDEATRLIEVAEADGKPTARGLFLLGLIRQVAGDLEAAEAHFLKAIYLDAQHDEALLALALLARRKGDVAAEAVYRRRADRVLARRGMP